jgi:hypothetical protein
MEPWQETNQTIVAYAKDIVSELYRKGECTNRKGFTKASALKLRATLGKQMRAAGYVYMTKLMHHTGELIIWRIQ